MLIAHASLALVASEKILKKDFAKKSTQWKVLLFLLALLFGILPDFDLFYLMMRGLELYDHHKLITHTPILWISIYILLRITYPLISKTFSKDLRKILSLENWELILNIFLISTLSHVFADLITGEINLLYPFTSTYLSTFKTWMPVNIFGGYTSYPLFYLELLIVVASVQILFKHFTEVKIGEIVKKFLILPSAITLSLLLILSTYLYPRVFQHQSVVKSDDNYGLYDMDFDGVRDIYDHNIGNTPTNNLLSISTEEILENIDTISQDPRKVVKYKERDIVENIYYKFGALDSSRSVFLTYSLSHKHIIPVLNIYLRENPYYEFVNYDKLLFDYLENEKLLEPVSNDVKEVNPPKILFIMKNTDEKLEVENMGMVNRDGMILTILDDSQKILFTLEELREMYKGDDILIYSQI